MNSIFDFISASLRGISETTMVAETKKKNLWRVPFYIFLGLCFGLAAFFNQFGIFHDTPIITKVLGAIAFCGAIGLLGDYAQRIRHTWFWLIPALASVEFFGDLVYKAGWWDIAFVIYQVSALLWPVYGILFIVKGAQLIREKDSGVGFKFIVLGILAAAVLGWEYVTLFPEQYDYSHWGWRSLYLAIFAWLLVIDWTTDFSKRPNLRVQQQIIRVSLLLIAVWYFVRFIFK